MKPNDAAMTSAERVALMRERRKKIGLLKLEVYAHPDDHDEIREFVANLPKTRKLKSKSTAS